MEIDYKAKFEEVLEKWMSSTVRFSEAFDRVQDRADKWYREREEAQREMGRLTGELSRLAGESFSSRDHTALKARVESAEKRCIELHRWIAQWRSRMGDHECWCKNGESTECQIELEMRRVLEGELVSRIRLTDSPLGYEDTMAEFYARVYKRMGEWERQTKPYVLPESLRAELRALLAEWHNRDRGLVGVANGN